MRTQDVFAERELLYRESGFTLIELLLVIILAAVLSVTVTVLFSRSDFDERFFFDDLRTALRYAQRYAVATGCRVQATISASGYVLHRDAVCESGAVADYSAAGSMLPLPGDVSANYENLQVPASAALSSASSPIIFRPDGTASNSAGTVFASVTISFGSRVLTIEGDTGFVR